MLKTTIRLLAITAGLLLIPIIASKFVEGWNWSFSDYVFAAVMFFGTGVLFEVGRFMSKNIMYRAGFGLALLTGFMIIWGNLAVGFIGSEDNPINLLYLGVLMFAFLAAITTKFQAQGLSKVMFATAVAIALIPVVGLIIGTEFAEIPQAAGTVTVIFLNSMFAALFVGSGLLFKQAAEPKQIAQ